MSDFSISTWNLVNRGNRTIGDINKGADGAYVFDADENTWNLELTSAELRAIADRIDELNTQSQTAKE